VSGSAPAWPPPHFSVRAPQHSPIAPYPGTSRPRSPNGSPTRAPPPNAGHYFIHSLRPPSGSPNTVQQAIEAATRSHGTVRLEGIARQANMSERQFRRRCLEESGLAPKHLPRAPFPARLLPRRQGLRWGLVAAEAGYFDQAHLIRDFQEFTGATPMSFFANTSHDARR
jgi:AraC-like DNA-binding protein